MILGVVGVDLVLVVVDTSLIAIVVGDIVFKVRIILLEAWSAVLWVVEALVLNDA